MRFATRPRLLSLGGLLSFNTQLHMIKRLAALHRQRRALRNATPEQLEDIGLTRREAEAEAKRPLWDVPCHWRKP